MRKGLRAILATGSIGIFAMSGWVFGAEGSDKGLLVQFIAETEASQSVVETTLDVIGEDPRYVRIVETAMSQASPDPAHDFSHSCRVLHNALLISQVEGGDPEVLVIAALLHDVCNLPKNHPFSKRSSGYSAELATELMQELGFSEEKIFKVHDAILCHSYSLGKKPQTLEGEILQDADRLDALGAVGLARAFQVSGAIGSSLYNPKDPYFKKERILSEKAYVLDHLFHRAYRLPNTMKTSTGKKLAFERLGTIDLFIQTLQREACSDVECVLRKTVKLKDV